MMATNRKPNSNSLPSLQASTVGDSSLAAPNAATSKLTPETTRAHHARRDQRNLIGAGNQAGDPQAVDAIGQQHAKHKQHGKQQRMLPAAKAGCGQGKEGGLRKGIEGKRKQRADQHDQHRI
jgi:hypothetical protein